MSAQDQVLKALSDAMSDLSLGSDWLSLILKSDRATLQQHLQRKDVAVLADCAAQAINEGQCQTAVSWIALGLYCYPERMADEVRRRGVFRCSKYRFRSGYLRPVIAELLAEANRLSISGELVRYMHSVSNLLRIGPSIGEIDSSLRKFLVRRKDRVLKTVVALVDSIFMLDHSADRLASSDNWRYYTKEDLAEAGSYIIHCFDDEIGMDDDHFNLLDEPALLRGLYHSVLVKACKIRHFLESEILVDGFDYRCTLRGRVVSIVPPSPELEMSIRLGYIQNEQAQQRSRISQIIAIRHGQPSLFKIADSFYDRCREQVVRTSEWPIRRYVFAFPDVPDFRSLFEDEGLLIEEQIYLAEILDAELATWDEVKRFEVRKGVSVFDLLKVYRLVTFIRLVAKRHLATVLAEDPTLAYRSLVPVFSTHQMKRLFGWCLPNDAIDKVIDMLSWKSGAGAVVDLQYRPILRGAEHLLTPMNITGTINWYRNLAYTQKRRVIDIAEEEAASRALAATLSRVSGSVRKGFKTTLGGKDIEIDVVARFGDYLFVFECKHALLACNVHELRTSYEHMKKGASTLTRIAALLSQRDIEAEFYRRLEWDVTRALDIVTCIVSCNGMFPGLTISGHPIRRWPELRNMIESGTVRVGSARVTRDESGLDIQADDLVERNVWGGSELTPSFLREYIKEGWLQKKLFGAMVGTEQRYRLGTWELVFPTFALDVNAATKGLENLV